MRRKNRSGYVLVLIALSVMGIMVSQATSRGTSEMYEMTAINQYAAENQMRWMAEGVLNYRLSQFAPQGANPSGPGPSSTAPGSQELYPAQLYFDKGLMAIRGWSSIIEVQFACSPDVSGAGYWKTACRVRWKTGTGGNPPLTDWRLVGWRQQLWDGNGNCTNNGVYRRNEPNLVPTFYP